MAMKLIWGALAGGGVAWLWGAISWMALSWHHATFRSFADEDQVARVMTAACPRSGVYGLPAPPRYAPGADKATRETADRAARERMISGPIVTAIVQREGFGSVPLAMARAFVIYAAAGAVLMWLVLQAAGLGYWEKTVFIAVVGLSAGLICRLPDWNWHGYSTAYTVVCVTDHVIGNALVGLALAAIA